MKTGRVVPIYPRVKTVNASYLEKVGKAFSRAAKRDVTEAEVVDEIITYARKTATLTKLKAALRGSRA